jgi:hypothetical protein
MPSEALYNRDDQNAVAAARDAVSAAVLPMLSQAETREQALLIAMSAVTASLGLAAGAYGAAHDIPAAEFDEIALAEEVLKMMREVRQQ